MVIYAGIYILNLVSIRVVQRCRPHSRTIVRINEFFELMTTEFATRVKSKASLFFSNCNGSRIRNATRSCVLGDNEKRNKLNAGRSCCVYVQSIA